jgi:hypothetical protein
MAASAVYERITEAGSKINLRLDIDGHDAIDFSVDANAKQFPTAFALSIRKSGSSIFSNIVTAIAQASGRTVVDIPNAAFQNNIAYRYWNDSDALPSLSWRGNVYVGFRDAPSALFGDPVFRQAKKILLVRDPRDALVSEYYSNAFSHSLPNVKPESSVVGEQRELAQQASIEDYVVERVDALNNTIKNYAPILTDQNLQIMRYEDVIFDKSAWMRQIAKTFEFDLSDQLISDILGWADKRPEKENPTNFIRRVTPGDHLEKLSPEVILLLEDALDEVWWSLGYARSNL